MTLRDCTRCGGPGVRNLGRDSYCAWHLEQLYKSFDPAVFAYRGVGLQEGPTLPEYGPAIATLRCNACDATWIGLPGETCAWCQDAYRRMLDWQTEVVLRPPDVDRDDVRHVVALEAWAERLWTAVTAGIIDRRQAETALRREARAIAA